MKLVQFPLQRPRSPPLFQFCSPLCMQPKLLTQSPHHHPIRFSSLPTLSISTAAQLLFLVSTEVTPPPVLGSILPCYSLLLFETCPYLGSVTKCHVLLCTLSWQALPSPALHVTLLSASLWIFLLLRLHPNVRPHSKLSSGSSQHQTLPSGREDLYSGQPQAGTPSNPPSSLPPLPFADCL